MSSTVEKLTEEVMALPFEAKRILADRLAENLSNDADAAFHKNWAAEAIRRRDDVRDGRVKTVPGDEALAQVRQSVSR
ncbi:MAG: addiction module protein [Verrucomicrobia bacterium]|nr:addiction module protein [Verrucomicrobiota bacterium]